MLRVRGAGRPRAAGASRQCLYSSSAERRRCLERARAHSAEARIGAHDRTPSIERDSRPMTPRARMPPLLRQTAGLRQSFGSGHEFPTHLVGVRDAETRCLIGSSDLMVMRRAPGVAAVRITRNAGTHGHATRLAVERKLARVSRHTWRGVRGNHAVERTRAGRRSMAIRNKMVQARMRKTPPMNIIECTHAQHARAILDILNDAILSSTALYDYQARPFESMRSWFDDKGRSRFPVLGAIDDGGTLLGFASYGAFRPRPAYKYSIEHSVYVHREHRGRGIG